MKIYIAHSSAFDFEEELYSPIRDSDLNKQHQIILPHEKSNEPFESKAFFKSCDLLIAEVSHPSTGLGIELGWANSIGCPVVCVYKKGSKISDSLRKITEKFLEYSNHKELIRVMETIIADLERHK